MRSQTTSKSPSSQPIPQPSITHDAVERLWLACSTPVGPEDDTLLVEGVIETHVFSRTALDRSRNEIAGLISNLPDGLFEMEGRSGASIALVGKDRQGNLWARSNEDTERMLCLAMAIGRARIVFPRSYWPRLPGGYPHVLFSRDEAFGWLLEHPTVQ